MGRRNDHTREELREMVLDATERIIVEHGMAGLSARKVASAVGYTVGSIYLVFRNLDDLLLQVNGRTLEQLYTYLQQARLNETMPRERLHALGRAYIDYALANGHRWRLVFEHRIAEEAVTPDYINRVSRMFALVEQELAELLPQQTPRARTLAAHALWSGVHGVAILGVDQKLQADHGVQNVFSTAEVAESLISGYLNGLMQQAG